MSAIKEHAENGNLRALCVMTAAYNTGQYGVDICQKTAVEYACRYVALLAENQASVPLEHFGIKHALSNSSVDNNQQALIALSYCDYIYAVKQNSVESGQKAVRELKKIKDISASLRGIIIDTCAIAHNINIVDSALFAQIENNVIKQLQQLEMQSNFTETIELFIAADGKFVIPLLQSLSHMPTACKKNINYILGLLCYYQKNPDYSVAQYYFELSEQNITDPLIQYICFICDQKVNSTSVTNRIASLITLIKNFNVLSKRQIRNHFVDKLLDHYLVENSISYIKELFNEQSYALTRDFFELLLQKQRTGALVIELLDQMNSDLSASKYSSPNLLRDLQHKELSLFACFFNKLNASFSFFLVGDCCNNKRAL